MADNQSGTRTTGFAFGSNLENNSPFGGGAVPTSTPGGGGAFVFGPSPFGGGEEPTSTSGGGGGFIFGPSPFGGAAVPTSTSGDSGGFRRAPSPFGDGAAPTSTSGGSGDFRFANSPFGGGAIPTAISGRSQSPFLFSSTAAAPAASGGIVIGSNPAPAPFGFSVPAPFPGGRSGVVHANTSLGGLFGNSGGLFGNPAPPPSFVPATGGAFATSRASNFGAGLFGAPVPEETPQPAPSEFINQVATLYNNQESSDVTLTVHGVVFHAHKIVLSVRAPLFWDEIKQGQPGNSFEIQGISSNVFAKMLEYMYTDTVQDEMTFEEATDILSRCDKYKLGRLKGICENRMAQFMSTELALDLLQASLGANALGLKKFSLDYIVRHWDDDKMKSVIRDFKVQAVEDGETIQEILRHFQEHCVVCARPHLFA